MPAIRSQQTNGFTGEMNPGKSSQTKYQADDDLKIGAALANKKMQLIEEENRSNGRSNGFHKGSQQKQQQDCEVFHDTQTLGAHSTSKKQQLDDEPIVIFDTQNNTSIAQTARDQFAAALLRLQSGLEVSSQRLDAIETKVEDLIRQSKQQTRQPQGKSRDAGSWAATLLGKGQLGTLLYLSWPVLVFVALRTIERRNMLNK